MSKDNFVKVSKKWNALLFVTTSVQIMLFLPPTRDHASFKTNFRDSLFRGVSLYCKSALIKNIEKLFYIRVIHASIAILVSLSVWLSIFQWWMDSNCVTVVIIFVWCWQQFFLIYFFLYMFNFFSSISFFFSNLIVCKEPLAVCYTFSDCQHSR